MTAPADDGGGGEAVHRPPDPVSFTAPLLVWRTEKYGDIGYVVIAGAAAEAISAHELVRGSSSAGGAGSLGQGRRGGRRQPLVDVVLPAEVGRWFLPVRKPICRAEGIEAAEIAVRLELL